MAKQKHLHPNHIKSSLFNKKDPIFSSWIVNKLTASLPVKEPAQRRALVYEVLGRLKDKYRINPVFLLLFICQVIRPLFWIKTRRSGKKEFRIPIRLGPLKQYKKGIK